MERFSTFYEEIDNNNKKGKYTSHQFQPKGEPTTRQPQDRSNCSNNPLTGFEIFVP